MHTGSSSVSMKSGLEGRNNPPPIDNDNKGSDESQ